MSVHVSHSHAGYCAIVLLLAHVHSRLMIVGVCLVFTESSEINFHHSNMGTLPGLQGFSLLRLLLSPILKKCLRSTFTGRTRTSNSEADSPFLFSFCMKRKDSPLLFIMRYSLLSLFLPQFLFLIFNEMVIQSV